MAGKRGKSGRKPKVLGVRVSEDGKPLSPKSSKDAVLSLFDTLREDIESGYLGQAEAAVIWFELVGFALEKNLVSPAELAAEMQRARNVREARGGTGSASPLHVVPIPVPFWVFWTMAQASGKWANADNGGPTFGEALGLEGGQGKDRRQNVRLWSKSRGMAHATFDELLKAEAAGSAISIAAAAERAQETWAATFPAFAAKWPEQTKEAFERAYRKHQSEFLTGARALGIISPEAGSDN